MGMFTHPPYKIILIFLFNVTVKNEPVCSGDHIYMNAFIKNEYIIIWP